MSNQPVERVERIALDLAKYICDNAKKDNQDEPLTKEEILQTYIESHRAIVYGEVSTGED